MEDDRKLDVIKEDAQRQEWVYLKERNGLRERLREIEVEDEQI